MSGGRVLVLGDDTRGFLATVRSLGRRGVAVHAAPTNFRAPALASRYIVAVHTLPPWMGDGAEWLATIETLLLHRFDLVIPCNETALLPLQHHRERLGALARLAIPDDAVIATLFDKHATRALAGGLGIPVAPGRLPRPQDNAQAVLDELGAPVVVKPRRSYELGQLDRRGRVQVVHDAALLTQLLPGLTSTNHLLEGFFPGQGLGVSLLASRGRVLQAFEHHRVHEDSSGSYYRVSAALSPPLLDACTAIVDALDYTGIGMFEFRRNAESGAWVLLEVNARPWGSLPLPVGLGVDFPWRWYRLLTAGEETAAVAYREGVFGRNLLPDLHATLAEARSLGPGSAAAAMLGRRILEIGRVLTGREIHDVLVRDDPRPAVAELCEALAEMLPWLRARLPGAATFARLVARARLRAALRRAGGAPPHLVFVCQGNICRSPFAAAALQRQLPGLAIGSAGTIPRPGRPTPEFGVAAAQHFGIDLSAHRSAWLSAATAAAATALLVFDGENQRAVQNWHPELRDRVIRLGDLLGGGDIADPIDGDAATFNRTYARIEAAVTELARLLGKQGERAAEAAKRQANRA